MILLDRNLEIKKIFENEKIKISELAKKYNLSKQRIYLILNKKYSYCEKHGIYFEKMCYLCYKDNRMKILNLIKNEIDYKEFKKYDVLKKREIVKKLVEKYKNKTYISEALNISRAYIYHLIK